MSPAGNQHTYEKLKGDPTSIYKTVCLTELDRAIDRATYHCFLERPMPGRTGRHTPGLTNPAFVQPSQGEVLGYVGAQLDSFP